MGLTFKASFAFATVSGSGFDPGLDSCMAGDSQAPALASMWYASLFLIAGLAGQHSESRSHVCWQKLHMGLLPKKPYPEKHNCEDLFQQVRGLHDALVRLHAIQPEPTFSSVMGETDAGRFPGLALLQMAMRS